MQLRPGPLADDEFLDELAGITGVGWTASTIGFIGALVGYGNTVASYLVAGPRSLLYLGIGFFLPTFGLDRLKNARSAEDE